VKASLTRLRATFDFPEVRVAPARTRAAPRDQRAPATGETKAVPAVGEGTPLRHVTLGQLIDAGLLRVPVEVSRRYRGVDLVAWIEAADRIVFAGTTYDSLSTAGGMARKSVVGETAGRAYPQTNGWTFWEIRATDGSRRQLDTLRRDLFESKVVNLPTGRRTG
jgi:hypothetical protein